MHFSNPNVSYYTEWANIREIQQFGLKTRYFLLNRSVCWATGLTSIMFWTIWCCFDGSALDHCSSFPICRRELFGVRLFQSAFIVARWRICARPWSFGLFLLLELWVMLVPAVFPPRALATIFEWEAIVESFYSTITSRCWFLFFEFVNLFAQSGFRCCRFDWLRALPHDLQHLIAVEFGCVLFSLPFIVVWEIQKDEIPFRINRLDKIHWQSRIR